jgi:hypothetical protein
MIGRIAGILAAKHPPQVLVDVGGVGYEIDVATKLAKGSTALPRAYVREQLPHWFSLHASTMDSALVAQINGSVRVQAIPNSSTSRES